MKYYTDYTIDATSKTSAIIEHTRKLEAIDRDIQNIKKSSFSDDVKKLLLLDLQCRRDELKKSFIDVIGG